MTTGIQAAYETLLASYGPQGAPPAASALERLLGVLFAQGSDRKQVERAMTALREAGLLDARALAEAPLEELAESIGPAASARKKAGRLRKLMRHLADRYDGSAEAMLADDPETLRAELAAINGVGRETADTILLEAAGVPIFVVDLAAHRVLKRHGWIELEADGEAIREQVESELERDANALGEFHTLMDRVGREHCRKTPLCEGCPLAPLLPPGGPLEEL